MENTNFLDGFYKQAGAMSKVKKYLSRNGASMGIGATIGALKGGMVGNETKGKDKKKNTAIGAAVGAVAGAGFGSVVSGIQNRKKLKHTKNIRDLNNWSRRVRGYGKEKEKVIVIAKGVDLSKDKAKTFNASFKKLSFLNSFYKQAAMSPDSYIGKVKDLISSNLRTNLKGTRSVLKKFPGLQHHHLKESLLSEGHKQLIEKSPKHLRGELFNQLKRHGQKLRGVHNHGFEMSQGHPIRRTIEAMREYSPKK